MLLIGRFLSPFVRRTATVLNLLGLSFEQKEVATADDADYIKQFNPLGRVPALVVDDKAIIDSHAIVDFALEKVGTMQTLLARAGAPRQRTLYLSAVAVGVMEKGVASAYEATQRPKEYFYEPYRDKLRGQVVAGLEHLDAELGDAPWFGGLGPDLADVDAVVAYDFANIIAAEAVPDLANLARLSDAANSLANFADTRWTG